MVGIKDVAEHAGVSVATVSRVMNGTQVAADLAERVRRSVDELGYVPDRTARSLRAGKSYVLALILPDIENPFFTTLARAVEDVAQQAGYSLVICNTDNDHEKESAYLRIVRTENMAGVLIAPATSDPAIDDLLAAGRAVVAVDRVVNADIDQVRMHSVALARQATEALIEQGYRRIACITGPRTTSTAIERAKGWRQAMKERGLQAEARLLKHTDFRVDGGRDAARRLLKTKNPPDAILATNNLAGVGCLQVLDELGSDAFGVAVIGELPFATSSPRGTYVVELQPRLLGATAATMLIERLQGTRTESGTVILPLEPARALRW